VADAGGRIAKAILSGRGDRDLVEELYLVSLSRLPSTSESENGLKYLSSAGLRSAQPGNETGAAQTPPVPGRAARAQDLLWALLNSKAFLYNY
jgi:hypothetical protein